MICSLRRAVIAGAAGLAISACALGQSGTSAEQADTPAQAGSAAGATIPPDQQASKEQLAKLFDAMRLREQMQSMRQMVPGMVQQQIKAAMQQTEADLPAGTKLTAEQRKGIENIMSKYVGKSMDLYPPEEMLTDMTVIYQRHLSKDDVDAMIAFYSSPAGQHLLNAQPRIAQEYMPMVMSKVTERSQAMTKEMMKEMAEIVPSAKQGAAKPAGKQGNTKPPATQ